MTELVRMAHTVPVGVTLRAWDTATPAERADLKLVLLQKLEALDKSSPTKALETLKEYQQKGII